MNNDQSSASPDPTEMDPKRIATLRAVMRALRAPTTGCPWDLEQTFASIAPYTIEEAYEVADAIDAGDIAGLCEELGDLLLQVVYHAQMAEEAAQFTFDDVVASINAKMIRRHPHVFGSSKTRSAALAKGFWETMKATEKPKKAGSSILEDVAIALPALTRAYKLQAKAARVGFDWPDAADVVDKISEECGELLEASTAKNQTQVTEELGDLLFALVNLGRHLDIDPELALRKTNAKFTRRFAYIEQRLAEEDRVPDQATLEEMDSLWEDAKRLERQSSKSEP